MKRIVCLLICGIFVLGLCGCEKFDSEYGKSVKDVQDSISSVNSDVSTVNLPEIMSDDDVMPTYVDISLYDEINYADIYLGKDFEYKITYDGSSIEVPSNYKNITQSGWSMVDSEQYNEDSQIMTGKTVQVEFINEYGKKLIAVFYNSKKSSVSLKKCPIVKFIIAENELFTQDSQYGQFWVNGVSNTSAITDVVEVLGSPSYFHKNDENKYVLEWFITANDKRSGITIYVDTAEDQIDGIEVSYY